MCVGYDEEEYVEKGSLWCVCGSTLVRFDDPGDPYGDRKFKVSDQKFHQCLFRKKLTDYWPKLGNSVKDNKKDLSDKIQKLETQAPDCESFHDMVIDKKTLNAAKPEKWKSDRNR